RKSDFKRASARSTRSTFLRGSDSRDTVSSLRGKSIGLDKAPSRNREATPSPALTTRPLHCGYLSRNALFVYSLFANILRHNGRHLRIIAGVCLVANHNPMRSPLGNRSRLLKSNP